MNFYQMPNALHDLDLHIIERGILTHIVRKTMGWGKRTDGISLSQFENALSISKNTILKYTNSLKNRGIITIKETFKGNEKKEKGFNVYGLTSKVISYCNIENPSISLDEYLVHEMNKGGSRDEQGVVHEMNKGGSRDEHTKETKQNTLKQNKKNIKKEKSTFDYSKHENLNIEAFQMWIEYKGKSYSLRGKTLSANKLSKFSKETQQDMVDNSIMSNYAGLFEVKQQNSNPWHTQGLKSGQNGSMGYFESQQKEIDDEYARRAAEADTTDTEIIPSQGVA